MAVERQNKAAEYLNQMWAFTKITRPFFLVGGFVLYGLGSAAAFRSGIPIQWGRFILGRVIVMFFQLSAQYINEYYDQAVDALNADNRTWFSGGSGVLAMKGISPGFVLSAARFCAVIGILAGAVACLITPWLIPIGILSLAGLWFYSAPPVSLMSSGWGEATTSLVVALFVPITAFTLQGGVLPGSLWLVCLPLILIHIAMLVSFEFPDYAADRAAGKETLRVRLGPGRSAWFVTGLIATAFILVAALALFTPYSGKWMALGAPFGVFQIVIVHIVARTPTRAGFRLLTAGGVGLFGFLSILALLEFIFLA